MNNQIHILILEDNTSDFELIKRELRKTESSYILEWAQDKKTFLQDLNEFIPDLVLLDYSLPGFDGLSALAIARQQLPDIPAIIVSGAIGEEVAIETLKAGATDYVLKQRLSRLGPVIDRAISEARQTVQRKAAELELRRQQEWLRVTLGSIGDAVITCNISGEITFLNPVTVSLTGWQQDEAMSQPLRNVFRIINEKTQEPAKDIAAQVLDKKCVVTLANHISLITKDSRIVPIEYNAAPILDSEGNLLGVVLVFHDVTERRRSQKELQKANEHLEVRVKERTMELEKALDLLASERELLKITLNSLGEGVVAADRDQRITFINEAAANLTGYSEAEAIGEPLNKILYIIDDLTSEAIDNVLAWTIVDHLILVTRDLREIMIAINSSPIKNIDGEVIGTVMILQDITEKQKTEQELLKAAKLDSLGILAGGVAHDFNNFLAGILANLQLATIKLNKHENIIKYLESTIEITRKASNLTKQLLTFAKGGAPVKKPTSVTKLVIDTVQFALSGSKVKAEFHLPEDLWMVNIDEGQIIQVINNLTINANQSMPTGGILEIYGGNIVFGTGEHYNPGQYVKLTVKDCGIGIPEEIIGKIFDPFFTTKKAGNGLGLSTSYSIIKKHDGYLEVESLPGIGTTFYILLPASDGESAAPESLREIAVSGEANILLMDDEDTIRNIGGEMLTCFGFRVTLARDGQEAIELYEKAKENRAPFDVVIMDLTIPGGLGGIEAMAILRQIEPEVKAIISSGYASDPVMSDYERYGFSGVVTKPYKFDELINVLNKVIDKKQLSLDLTY